MSSLRTYVLTRSISIPKKGRRDLPERRSPHSSPSRLLLVSFSPLCALNSLKHV